MFYSKWKVSFIDVPGILLKVALGIVVLEDAESADGICRVLIGTPSCDAALSSGSQDSSGDISILDVI